MDLGIRGKTALVCAASKGLGKGCATSLAREGVNLVITARGRDALEATAEEIRKATGAKVTTVAGDITTPEGRAQALAACPRPDILVNNAGGPPPGDFRQWTREDWLKAIDANMLTPIELIKATLDGMIERRFGRIVNITSSAVKAPIAELGLSNGARTGLTGFVAGIARRTDAQHKWPQHGSPTRPGRGDLRGSANSGTTESVERVIRLTEIGCRPPLLHRPGRDAPVRLGRGLRPTSARRPRPAPPASS